jgi:hypothetical protein
VGQPTQPVVVQHQVVLPPDLVQGARALALAPPQEGLGAMGLLE